MRSFDLFGIKLRDKMIIERINSAWLSLLNKVIPTSPARKKSGIILNIVGAMKKSVRTVHPHHIEMLKSRNDFIRGLVIIKARETRVSRWYSFDDCFNFNII